MKYLAAALILLAMAWTWTLSIGDREFGLQQHKALEAQVQDAIRAAVKEKRPDVADVVFQQLFTETIRAGEEVRARFRYQITETSGGSTKDAETTAQTVEGSAKLTSNDGGKTWAWVDQNVTSAGIEFQKGTRVGPEAAKLPDAPAEAAPAPAPAHGGGGHEPAHGHHP